MDQITTHALVWTEGTAPDTVYPNDINATIAEHLNEHSDIAARTASLDDHQQGVSDEALEWADTLLWWGHLRHDEVTDETVSRVEEHVTRNGLGYVGLHSGHYARPFKRLLGASGDLGSVRDDGEMEKVEVTAPEHPIASGVDDFALPAVEMFGEPYDVPAPDAVVFTSSYENGGEFRSGVTFTFGEGRGFYFRPGHEEYRIYHDQNVRRVLANATRWTARTD